MFAGTIWPTNLTSLSGRPTPEDAAAGANAIPDLLNHPEDHTQVPDIFTAADLDAARAAGDPRVATAIATASTTTHPDQGHKIIQVLAGGTQLAHRVHPPPGHRPADVFNPGARAVLHAAGDLRRVGMLNPIPRWALEGAAPGYLQPSTPARTWLAAALDEATHDATTDDPVTGNRSLDVHAKGVPALAPHWTTNPDGQAVEAYDLHDYLYQDHLAHHRTSPTRPHLWDTLTSHIHNLDDPLSIAAAAADRGLLTTAIDLMRTTADAGDQSAQYQLAALLADRGGDAALAELRTRADAGDQSAQNRLAGLLADRGGDAALAELRTRADAGDQSAQNRLAWLLADRGGDAALAELRTRADAGDQSAQNRLAWLLARRGGDAALAELRSQADAGDQSAQNRLAGLLARRDGDAALAELRTRADAGDWVDQARLAGLLAGRGDDAALAELRSQADGDVSAQARLADPLAGRGDDAALAELRSWADAGDVWAQARLADLLARRGDDAALAELRTRADAGDLSAQDQLAHLIAGRGDDAALAELRAVVLAGYGGSLLLQAYRNRSPDRHISELDCDARPRYAGAL